MRGLVHRWDGPWAVPSFSAVYRPNLGCAATEAVYRYGRIVAVCNIAGVQGLDVNAMMVAEGWAVAYRRLSTDYVPHEDAAKKARRGLWRGEFQIPWDCGDRRGVIGDDAPGWRASRFGDLDLARRAGLAIIGGGEDRGNGEITG